jgi:hypothetical protein
MHHHARRGWLIALLVAALCVACREPEAQTQLLVWVRADATLAATLQQVRVALYADDQNTLAMPRREKRFDIGTGADGHKLPFSFSIVHRENPALTLVVRGYTSRDADALAVVEQRMSVTFLLRRTLEVSVMLTASEPSCREDERDPNTGACPQPKAAQEHSEDPGHENEPAACEDLEEGVCDPVAQCNCSAPLQCQVVSGQGICVSGGTIGLNEACEYNGQCLGDLTCAWGACRHACRTREDCKNPVSASAECVRREPERFGFCAEPCAKPGAPRCAEGLICSPIKTDKVDASICLHVEERCTTIDDGVCDEAGRGTGFCEADSDANDCCNRPRAAGECDVVTQCGCSSDQACRADSFIAITAFGNCAESGQTPLGSGCEQDSDCVRGAGCYQSLCKRLCNTAGVGRCPAGPCVALPSDAGVIADTGSCWVSCNWKTHEPCAQDTVCARLEDGDFCHKQPSTCPEELQNNGQCDELTRVCAPGTDSDADCER